MKSRGFTLIEVLAALFIVAWVLASSALVAMQTTDSAAHLKAVTLASWVAADQLTLLHLAGGFPPLGDTEGEASEGDQSFRWRQHVRATPNAMIRAVQVEVFAPDDPATSILSRQGFLVRLNP